MGWGSMVINWRKEVFTANECAEILHVSLSTVYRMIKAGILVPTENKIGMRKERGQLIPKSEIEHYVESLKTSARRRTLCG